jgi:GxxExxY protein
MKRKQYATPLPYADLTHEIIAAYYHVMDSLGARRGVPEHAFRDHLAADLRARGMSVETEKVIQMKANGQTLAELRIDIVVNGLIVIELKNVCQISSKNEDQATLYLDYGGYPAGLILNYGGKATCPQRIPLPKRYHKEPRRC